MRKATVSKPSPLEAGGNLIDKIVPRAEQTVVQVSIAYCCCFLLPDHPRERHVPPVISILMAASECCSHRGRPRKPTPKKPSSKTRDENTYIYGRLLADNKTQIYLQKDFPKQVTEYKCEQNRSPGGEKKKGRVGREGIRHGVAGTTQKDVKDFKNNWWDKQ